MPDLSADVAWQEILSETQAGNIPHCRAIAAPSKFHDEIIEALAKLILGSYRPNHPDLLVIGSIDKPAPIGNSETMNDAEYKNSARWLIEDIALKPLEAQRRLGVVMCADRLLKPAANSLLKLAEEPPTHAYLLFLMEDGRMFLPTLRSRSRFSVIVSHDDKEAYAMPSSEPEWLEWLTNTRKASDIDAIIQDLDSWSNFAAFNNDFGLAARLDRLRLTADRKNLSVPFLCDMIILTLKGDNRNIEHIFNDLW